MSSVSLRRGLTALWLLALVLSLVGLGQVPLRDWDEGIVARVALEASRRPWPDLLLPVYWGDPYLNKPPGLHLLIAGAIRLWRSSSGSSGQSLPPEAVLRLLPALLSSTVVPLVGLLQARLRPGQPAVAGASAAMALTLLPLARHGRLVMLDGSQLAAILLLWWALLTPDLRPRSLVGHGGLMGLAVSALLLLKAPLALPMLVASLLLRALDRELRGAQWRWLLLGLAAGLVPGLAWHGAHLLLRGPDALAMWGSQGFARVHQRLEGHGGGPAMPILEVLKGGWPWLALWPGGMGLAWRERRSRAGRWVLGTTVLTAALVLPLRTQLPWYSHLLWPPLLWACAPVLVWLVERRPALAPPWPGLIARVPAFWTLQGALLCPMAVVVGLQGNPALQPLAPVAAWAGLGLLAGGGLLLARREGRRLAGVLLLFTGLWAALLQLLAGPLWLWELNENWAVRPVAAIVREHPEATVGLWQLPERPSLSWYAGRRLLPWQGTGPLPDLLITAGDGAPRVAGAACSPLAGSPSPGPQGPGPQVFRCMRTPGTRHF